MSISKPSAAMKELRAARAIIDLGENRALASDGPVGHCREELTNEEFDRMWHHVEAAMKILRPKPKAEAQAGIRRVMELASAKRKAQGVKTP